MKWEYMTHETIHAQLKDDLNVFGLKGWELITASYSGRWLLIFKRPAED